LLKANQFGIPPEKYTLQGERDKLKIIGLSFNALGWILYVKKALLHKAVLKGFFGNIISK
jgi:hypothetical protein